MKLDMTVTDMTPSEFQNLMMVEKNAFPVSLPTAHAILYVTDDGKLVGAKVLYEFGEWLNYLY